MNRPVRQAHPLADDRRRANRALIRDSVALLVLLFLLVWVAPVVIR